MQPTDITLLQKQKVLKLQYDNDLIFELPVEYLRVFSPSAEVQGHGSGPGVLVIGKQQVNITSIEPVGHYAVKLIFDDGHDSGLYSFEKLYELATHFEVNWADYKNQCSNLNK